MKKLLVGMLAIMMLLSCVACAQQDPAEARREAFTALKEEIETKGSLNQIIYNYKGFKVFVALDSVTYVYEMKADSYTDRVEIKFKSIANAGLGTCDIEYTFIYDGNEDLYAEVKDLDYTTYTKTSELTGLKIYKDDISVEGMTLEEFFSQIIHQAMNEMIDTMNNEMDTDAKQFGFTAYFEDQGE